MMTEVSPLILEELARSSGYGNDPNRTAGSNSFFSC
jgi:hypothetical protein